MFSEMKRCIFKWFYLHKCMHNESCMLFLEVYLFLTMRIHAAAKCFVLQLYSKHGNKLSASFCIERLLIELSLSHCNELIYVL